MTTAEAAVAEGGAGHPACGAAGGSAVSPAEANPLEARRRAHRTMTRAWFDRLAPERAAWRARNHYYYEAIERLARAIIPPGAQVLELGCGIGDLLAAVRPSLGVGIDLSEGMVQVAQARHGTGRQPHPPRAPDAGAVAGQPEPCRLLFVCGDAHALPLRTTFDYVICSDLLGHLEDIQLVLARLHDVCTPQTKVLITYWNFVWQGVLALAERLGLKMPQRQENWLGRADVENLLLLTDFATLERGVALLCPKPVPLLAPALNRGLLRLPGMQHLALVNHWIVQPKPRPAAEPLSCSVIIPCRNEEGNIAACVARMPPLGTHTELIFVDGASTDRTRERILEQIEQYAGIKDIKLLDQVPDPLCPPPPEIAPFAATTDFAAARRAARSGSGACSAASTLSDGAPVTRAAAADRPGLDGAASRATSARPDQAGRGSAGEGQGERPVRMLRLGKGDAVRKGFAAASGDVLMILDADLTVPPEELPKFLEPIATGKADFVNGTRLVYPLEEQAMMFHRLLGNKFFSLLFTWLLGQSIKDTLCGTKVLRKRDYEVLAANRSYFGDFDPFGDFDLLFGAARLGLRIVEVPVRYRARTSGYSKVQVAQHAPLLLRMSWIGFKRLKLARWLRRGGPPWQRTPSASVGKLLVDPSSGASTQAHRPTA
jgi:glycosyltransferase involved in cell wall biosynthesis/SAM-dependent methyltransferase